MIHNEPRPLHSEPLFLSLLWLTCLKCSSNSLLLFLCPSFIFLSSYSFCFCSCSFLLPLSFGLEVFGVSCSRGESCWAFGRKFKSLPSLFLTLVKYFTEESHKPQTVLQIDHWVALCLSESRKDLTLVCTLSHLPSSVITFSLYSHHLSTYAVLLQLRDIFFHVFCVSLHVYIPFLPSW